MWYVFIIGQGEDLTKFVVQAPWYAKLKTKKFIGTPKPLLRTRVEIIAQAPCKAQWSIFFNSWKDGRQQSSAHADAYQKDGSGPTAYMWEVPWNIEEKVLTVELYGPEHARIGCSVGNPNPEPDGWHKRASLGESEWKLSG